MAEVFDYNKSGIYAFVNKINGMFYIGSATIFRKRWDLHLNELRKNKHKNPYLQNVYNKYGEINFQFIILEYCEKQNY